jgi:hypothetical protein
MKNIYYFLILFLFVFSFSKSQNKKFNTAIGIEPFLLIPNKIIGQINHNKSNSSIVLGFRYPSFNNTNNSRKNFDLEFGIKKNLKKLYGPQFKLLFRKYEGFFDYYLDLQKGYGYRNKSTLRDINCGVIAIGYFYNFVFNKKGVLELNFNIEYQQFFTKKEFSQWYGIYTKPIYGKFIPTFKDYLIIPHDDTAFDKRERPYYLLPFKLQLIYHFKRNKPKELKTVS